MLVMKELRKVEWLSFKEYFKTNSGVIGILLFMMAYFVLCEFGIAKMLVMFGG